MLPLARAGAISAGTRNNLRFLQEWVTWPEGLEEAGRRASAETYGLKRPMLVDAFITKRPRPFELTCLPLRI